MSNALVRHWFKDRFGELHPMLQKLHTVGGTLRGDVLVTWGNGVAGFIGGLLAKMLNIPDPGPHKIIVQISHHADGLHWDRCFDYSRLMKSTFVPVGEIGNGYWTEQSGPLKMRLTVDVKDGGWHWRCLAIRFQGIPLPVWLFPKSKAYKTVENGLYRFYVGYSLPVIGELLSYSGLLKADFAN